jgi:hypothetical protein
MVILEDISNLLNIKRPPIIRPIAKPVMNLKGTPYKVIRGGLELLPAAAFTGIMGAALLKKHAL